MDAIVKRSNFIVGYFVCVSFNSEFRKDPGLNDMENAHITLYPQLGLWDEFEFGKVVEIESIL